MQTIIKDPDAVLDYSVDWSRFLGTDTISSSAWIVNGPSASGMLAAMVSPAPSHTDSTATVWLEDGISGQTYTVTNRIVTAAGRTNDKTFKIVIQEK